MIIFDETNEATALPLIPRTIKEIYNTVGPIPIVLIGLNRNSIAVNEHIQDIIEEDYVFYFEFQNKFNFYEKILKFIAELSIKILKNAKDVLTTRIREEFKRYYDLKQECLNNFYEIIQAWGLRIINDKVEILNRHGLFTIDLLSGNVIYESIMCESCEKGISCQKKQKSLRKKLCIVADSVGWSNFLIGGDKLLILSKILAILREDLPNHVLKQMQEIKLCLQLPKVENLKIPEIEPQVECDLEDYLIYKKLSKDEKESRIKQLRKFLWEGRIPPTTYYQMLELLSEKNQEKFVLN